MPNITTNTITFESEDDLQTIKKFMNRIHPSDMLYLVKEVSNRRIGLSNIAIEDDIQYFDTNTNFFDFGDKIMPNKYDTLANHLNEIHVGDYLEDNRVQDDTDGRHFFKRTPEDIKITKNTDRFNFQWIEPQPNTVTNFKVQDDHNLVQPKIGDDNFWYTWNVDHWNTKWNSMDVYYDDTYITFYTAWDNVEPLVEKLADMFPDIPMEYDVDYEGGDEPDTYLFNYRKEETTPKDSDINPYMDDVINDLHQFLRQHDCEINYASNMKIIKEIVDDAEQFYINAGSKGIFKAQERNEQLITFRNNIDEYESMYPEIVDDNVHFIKWPRPNGTMHLLSFDEAINLLANSKNFA